MMGNKNTIKGRNGEFMKKTNLFILICIFIFMSIFLFGCTEKATVTEKDFNIAINVDKNESYTDEEINANAFFSNKSGYTLNIDYSSAILYINLVNSEGDFVYDRNQPLTSNYKLKKNAVMEESLIIKNLSAGTYTINASAEFTYNDEVFKITSTVITITILER